MRLDISAPQFIVPKDLLDGDTNMMVFDLGKLKVTNLDSQDEDDQPTFSLDPGGQEAQEDDLDIMDDGRRYDSAGLLANCLLFCHLFSS